MSLRDRPDDPRLAAASLESQQHAHRVVEHLRWEHEPGVLAAAKRMALPVVGGCYWSDIVLGRCVPFAASRPPPTLPPEAPLRWALHLVTVRSALGS